MKTNLIQALAIVVVIGGIFINSQSAFSQPAPDKYFCAVQASILPGDSVCQVIGNAPWYYNWDDGTAEDYALWIKAGGISAVKFSPAWESIHLTAGEIYVGDGSFPVGGEDILGTDFLVVVYNDDGPEGFPGTLLDSLLVTVENYGWVAFTGIDVVIEEGGFYLGMKQLYDVNEEQAAAPIGIDTDLPTMHASYIKAPPQFGDEWEYSPYQDFMIRAYSCSADNKKKELIREYSSWYQIARITDFDPSIGEVPENGVFTR